MKRSDNCQPVNSSGEIGKIVAAVRVAAGLRQIDAAGLCGISVPVLNALERGKGTVKLINVLKIFQGLGISLSLLPPERIPENAPTSLRRRRTENTE